MKLLQSSYNFKWCFLLLLRLILISIFNERKKLLLLNFYQIGEISPNLVTLIRPLWLRDRVLIRHKFAFQDTEHRERVGRRARRKRLEASPAPEHEGEAHPAC